MLDREQQPIRLDPLVERFLRLGERDAVIMRRLDGAQGQADAFLRVLVEARDRGGRELPRASPIPCGPLRSVRLVHGDHRQCARDEGGRRQHPDERTQPRARAPLDLVFAGPAFLLLGAFLIAMLHARLQELPLERADREVGALGPGRRLVEPGPAEQEAPIALGPTPFRAGLRHLSLQAKALTPLVDPGPEPVPRRQQCLVGDLDRRLSRRRLAIEGQEAVAPVRLEHAIHGLGVDVEYVELRPSDPAPRVLPSLPEGHEAQEHLPDGPPSFRAARLVEPVGARGDGAGDSAHRHVGLQAQSLVLATLEQLRECVLQQRERSRLMDDVGDDLRDEPGLGRDADLLGRTADRLLELVRRERRHRLGATAEQLTEARGRERPVEEVRPERHDHADPAGRVDACHATGIRGRPLARGYRA